MHFKNGQIWNGDCLELMKFIPDNSVDMILCDLPYGTTQNKWDTIIPFAPLWEQYWRIAKPNAAVVLTAQCPFDKILGCSQIDFLKYEWIWRKSNATGHLNAKKQPMKAHENVLIFYRNQPIYNPQMTEGIKESNKSSKKEISSKSSNYGTFENYQRGGNLNRFPVSVQFFNSVNSAHKPQHPTQKPVALFEYLIKTYTNPGDCVLDNCAGSGTTAIAAERTGRRWLCIEKNPGYYFGACGRIWKETNAL